MCACVLGCEGWGGGARVCVHVGVCTRASAREFECGCVNCTALCVSMCTVDALYNSLES